MEETVARDGVDSSASTDKMSTSKRIPRSDLPHVEATRREWRELGFFYDRDDTSREWRVSGSRSGLLRLRDLLLAYAADPRRRVESEHEHYGPYQYLEVMTWPEAGFDAHAIRGSLADLERLARTIEARVNEAGPGQRIRIREDFATNSPYSLVLEVREDGFDPATGDSGLSNCGPS